MIHFPRTRQINRRAFLKRAGAWGLSALALSALPGCGAARRAMASEDTRRRYARAQELGMREIAEQRLHHGSGRFINPFMEGEHGGLGRVLRWKLFSRNRFKDRYAEETVRPIDLDWRPFREQGDCAVMFLRHSSVLIRDLDRVLLVDPIFSGLFWFDDFSPIRSGLERMPAPDHVLLTHGHYDHLDVRSLRSLDPATHVITPLGYEEILEDAGMAHHTQLDWYQGFRDRGLEVLLLPCHHWTMRNPFTGPNRNLWGSYLIRGASGRTVFLSGDAAWFDRYEEIGREFDVDLAVFNLGAYEPRWFMAQSHINPEETVKAFRAPRARRLLVVHWGAFRLGDEPVHLPPLDIRREMEKAGLSDRLVHLDPGGTTTV